MKDFLKKVLNFILVWGKPIIRKAILEELLPVVEAEAKKKGGDVSRAIREFAEKL